MDNPTPRLIKESLDSIVIGQDQAKMDIANLLYMQWVKMKRNTSWLKLEPTVHLNGLVTGRTGSGKTLLCSSACDILGLPFYKIDGPSIVPPGADGDDILKLLKRYIDVMGSKYKYEGLLNYGVIYIDEFDKLGGNIHEGHNAKYYANIQDSLLTVLDGCYIKEFLGNAISTDNMLFIFSGSFDIVREHRTLGSRPIGVTSNWDKWSKEIEQPITRDEVLKAGIIKELVGRINVITHTERLSKSEIRDIIFMCDNNIYSQFTSLFTIGQSNGVELTEEVINSIVDKVYDGKFGMRAIKTLLYEALSKQIFELKEPKDPLYKHYPQTTWDQYCKEVDDEYVKGQEDLLLANIERLKQK